MTQKTWMGIGLVVLMCIVMMLGYVGCGGNGDSGSSGYTHNCENCKGTGNSNYRNWGGNPDLWVTCSVCGGDGILGN